MKLWKIEQSINHGYDTYSDAVVAAETEDEAKTFHPDGNRWSDPPKDDWSWSVKAGGWSWVSSPDQVSVTLLGDAAAGIEPGVICASFHAG